jgi:hypothetical protein
MIPSFGQAVSLARFDWVSFFQSISNPELGAFAFVIGGFLGFMGVVAGTGHPRSAKAGRLTSAGCLAYILVLAVAEPLLFVGDSTQLPWAVGWLAPMTIGAVLSFVRGYWFAGLACWAVLYSGMAALSYNLSHTGSGIGFLCRWLG